MATDPAIILAKIKQLDAVRTAASQSKQVASLLHQNTNAPLEVKKPVSDRKWRICGNLIIKNEQINMKDVINSIAPYCDAIAILDTGSRSTDAGVSIAQETMAELGIPGKIRCVNMPSGINFHFGNARTEALRFAEEVVREQILKDTVVIPQGPLFKDEYDYYNKNTNNWYVFTIDADNRVITSPDGPFIDKTALGAEKYDSMFLRYVTFSSHCMCKLDLDRFHLWCWKDERHEYCTPVGDYDWKKGQLKHGYILSGRTGERAVDGQETYRIDQFLFERRMIKDPYDDRALFYAGQSARDAGNKAQALTYYIKRGTMARGWHQERYVALVEAGKLHFEIYPNDHLEGVELFMKAMDICHDRLEAVYHVVDYYRDQKMWKIGWAIAKDYLHVEYPSGDTLFITVDIHKWKFNWVASLVAYYANDFESFKMLTNRVLACTVTPEHVLKQANINLTLMPK